MRQFLTDLKAAMNVSINIVKSVRKSAHVIRRSLEMDKNMMLPQGKTCKNCVHCERCTSMFGKKETDMSCDFYPIRYYEIKTQEENID